MACAAHARRGTSCGRVWGARKRSLGLATIAERQPETVAETPTEPVVETPTAELPTTSRSDLGARFRRPTAANAEPEEGDRRPAPRRRRRGVLVALARPRLSGAACVTFALVALHSSPGGASRHAQTSARQFRSRTPSRRRRAQPLRPRRCADHVAAPPAVADTALPHVAKPADRLHAPANTGSRLLARRTVTERTDGAGRTHSTAASRTVTTAYAHSITASRNVATAHTHSITTRSVTTLRTSDVYCATPVGATTQSRRASAQGKCRASASGRSA